jgi:hypothetical protein
MGLEYPLFGTIGNAMTPCEQRMAISPKMMSDNGLLAFREGESAV